MKAPSRATLFSPKGKKGIAMGWVGQDISLEAKVRRVARDHLAAERHEPLMASATNGIGARGSSAPVLL
jgi:hypothetical protein